MSFLAEVSIYIFRNNLTFFHLTAKHFYVFRQFIKNY